MTSSPAQVVYSSPVCLAASLACAEASCIIHSAACCWSAVRSASEVVMACTISPHSSAWASSRPQLSAASRSLSGSPWSASVFRGLVLQPLRRDAATSRRRQPALRG